MSAWQWSSSPPMGVSGAGIELLESRTLLHGVGSDPHVHPADAAVQQAAAAASASAISMNWQNLSDAPLQRFEGEGAVADGKLYVFGGFDNSKIQITSEVDMLDPATNTWSVVGNMPGPQTHVGTATDGRTVYMVGGYAGNWIGKTSSDFWEYDTVTGSWTQGPSLPAARGAGGLVLIGRQLHFFGGLESDLQTDSPDQWVFDLDNPSQGWVAKAPLADPRNHIGYAVLDGKIYVIGGQHALNEDDGQDAAVSVYDPATDSWSAAASLPVPRSHLHNSTVVFDGKIICVGGSDFGDVSSDDVLMYDPATNEWTTIGHLPEARSATVARVAGNQLIVTTGTPTGVLPQTTTWAWDINLNATSAAQPVMPQISAGLPASVVVGTKAKVPVTLTNTSQEAVTQNVGLNVYLSGDTTLDASDVLVGTATKRLKFGAGQTIGLGFNVKVPIAQADGSYYLLVDAQKKARGQKTASASNIAVSPEQIDVVARSLDLSAQLTPPSASIAPGAKGSVNVILQNLGTVAGTGRVTLTLTGAGQDEAIVLRGTDKAPMKLAAGQVRNATLTFRLPDSLAAGSYELTLRIDATGQLQDADTLNNVAQSALLLM